MTIDPTRPTATATIGSAPRTDLATFEAYRAIEGDIDGWFGAGAIAVWDALLCFQREKRVRGHMLEIGVWHGKSAALLAMHADPGSRLHLVDHELKQAEIERALAAANADPSVEVLTMAGDSRDLHVSPIMAECFGAHRFVHVDGEHSARAVTNDMAIASQLLAKDGVLVVDDFFSWLYPQVTEGVLRYVRNQPDDFALFLCGYNKAYLARPHFVHEYLAFCAERLPAALAARGVEATVAKTTWPAEMNTFGVGPRFQDKALRGPDWADTAIRY